MPPAKTYHLLGSQDGVISAPSLYTPGYHLPRIWVLPLINPVISGKWLKLSKFQFLIRKKGLLMRLILRIQMNGFYKVPNTHIAIISRVFWMTRALF